MGDQQVVSDGHDGFAHGFVAVERDLDFSKFDAESVHFDLVVGASPEFEDIGGMALGEVSGVRHQVRQAGNFIAKSDDFAIHAGVDLPAKTGGEGFEAGGRPLGLPGRCPDAEEFAIL